MADIKISFIIPVYNPSRKDDYFSVCLESINKIRHANDEVLIIDDGSKNTKYIQEVCQKYDSISIIRIEKNSGISNARNVGISRSHNEYVVIADSDDYFIDIDAFERVRRKVAKSNNHDLYIFGTIGEVNNELASSICSDKQVNLNDLRIQALHRRSAKYQPKLHSIGTTWGKVFKRSFIIENNLKFCRLPNRAEDEVFILDFLARKPKIEIIEEYAYFYRTNPTSISNKFNKKVYELYRNTIIEMEKRIDQNNPKEREAFLRRKAFYVISPVLQAFRKENKQRLSQKIKTVKTILSDNNNLNTLRLLNPKEYTSGAGKIIVRLLRRRMILATSILLEARKDAFLYKEKIDAWSRRASSFVASPKKRYRFSRPVSAFRSLF